MQGFDSFAPPQLPERPRHRQGWKHFWTFLIPAISGWFAAVFLYLLSGSGLEYINVQSALGMIPMALALMPISLVAAPGIILCLAACAAFSASMRLPNLRKLKPLSAAALGLIVFCVLGFTLPDLMGERNLENLTPWPFWLVQVPAGVITAASAWAASAWFFRNRQAPEDQESLRRAGNAGLNLSNYPRPPRRRRPPMRQAMMVFLSCFLPAISGWVAVLTLFLVLSLPSTGSGWSDLIWLPLWLPVFMTISLTLKGVWFFLLACTAFGLSMMSPHLRGFKVALAGVLAVAVYFCVEVENLEGIFRGLSGRLPETAPLFILQIAGALVTGGVAWLTTSRLFHGEGAMAKPDEANEVLPASDAPSLSVEDDREAL